MCLVAEIKAKHCAPPDWEVPKCVAITQDDVRKKIRIPYRLKTRENCNVKIHNVEQFGNL